MINNIGLLMFVEIQKFESRIPLNPIVFIILFPMRMSILEVNHIFRHIHLRYQQESPLRLNPAKLDGDPIGMGQSKLINPVNHRVNMRRLHNSYPLMTPMEDHHLFPDKSW